MRNIILAAFVAIGVCFPASAQTTGGGGTGVDIVIPIDFNEPYKLDPKFLSMLWGDLYGRNFIPGESAMWLGEHLDDDPEQPRRAILLERDSNGVLSAPLSPEHVVFEEVARYPVEWVEVHAEQFWTTTLTDPSTGDPLPPAEVDVAEYEDALVLRFTLPDGTTRLIVGFTKVVHVDILTPISERTNFRIENFWPLERFFSEGQAGMYARDYAAFDDTITLDDPPITLGAGNPCSGLTGVVAELCYCLVDIGIDFDADMSNCNFPPDGVTTLLKVGGMAGGGGLIGGGLLQKLVKRAAPWTGVAAGATAAVVGGAAGYGWEVHACKTRAKTLFDARKRKAQNSANRAINTGSPFECPPHSGGPH